MTHFQAIVLGIIQGLTEFFPVSSSTHLFLAKRFMNVSLEGGDIYFDLLCHVGTLFACLFAFRKDIAQVLSSFRQSLLFAIALIPLFPAYILLKPLRMYLAPLSGLFLCCMSALLFFASRTPIRPLKQSAEPPSWKEVLCIGCMQGLSLLPGFSRSGSTISMARLLGWKWEAAVRFSFLLSIPTILGASLLETLHLSSSNATLPWTVYLCAACASFVVGIGAIRLLVWVLNRQTLRPFAWYCLAVGLCALIWLG